MKEEIRLIPEDQIVIQQIFRHPTVQLKVKGGLEDTGIPIFAFSPEQFRKSHGDMSASLYQKLKANGLGPKESHLGGKIVITYEAAAEWRAREFPEPKKLRDQRKARAHSGAEAAVQSPNHVSNAGPRKHREVA